MTNTEGLNRNRTATLDLSNVDEYEHAGGGG